MQAVYYRDHSGNEPVKEYLEVMEVTDDSPARDDGIYQPDRRVRHRRYSP